MTTALPILVWTGDLFFRAKIEATARALAIPLHVSATATVPEDGAFSGCIVDLAAADEAALARVSGFAAAGHPTVGFFAHVHADLAQRALAAGCREVLPRSRFSAELPELLARLQRGGA